MAEETTNTKWKQLQEMRKANGGEPGPAETIPVAVAPPTPVEPPKVDPPIVTAPATPPPADPPPVVAAPDATPRSVEIEIDGQKISVDPMIAEAFSRADKVTQDNAKVAERQALKAEMKAEILAELPPPPPVKTPAEIAADRALAEASRLKMPDEKLLLSDPGEWQRQMALFNEQQIKLAKDETRAEIEADARRHQTTAAAQQETHARGVLREQFYIAYPVFKGSEDLVNVLLNTKFDEVVASGQLNKPMTPTEGEALKAAVFADVTKTAAKKILAITGTAKRIAPPTAPTPPTTVSSAPVKVPTPTLPESPKRKEKYPKGSVSALLAAHKASRDEVSAKPVVER